MSENIRIPSQRDQDLLLGDRARPMAEWPAGWRELWQACDQCVACPLAKSRQNVVLFRGAFDAPCLILGEGPGREEDERALPFCGRSGRLLDAALKALEFSPQSVHIANMVKCRPPENRTPLPDELAACRPHLRAQFKLLRPRVIILLGNTAYQNFTGRKEGISKVRGQWLEEQDTWVIGSYHPAYILRDQRRKPELFEDLLKARHKLEELGLMNPMQKPL